jgi:N-acetylmuramoyl-L-alanine amidase
MSFFKNLPALILTLGIFSYFPVVAQSTRSGARINTIIVDAGHGGSDPGARGRYSTEAQITLKLAIRLEEILKRELAETRIVMTRTTDIFHSVREKADIANQQKGDLFVCIHVNAAPPRRHRELTGYKTRTYYTGKGKKRKKVTKKEPVYKTWTTPSPAQGTSTYVFAADRSDEKASGLLEERYESESEVVDVPDPKSPEAVIQARLWSQKFFKNSVRLGSFIEEEFVKIGRKSWGVLQRNHMGIWVLQATNMPAVLIETGFITNEEEEDYLNSDAGQQEMVRAIANAVIRYKTQVETPAIQKQEQTTPVTPEKSSATSQR